MRTEQADHAVRAQDTSGRLRGVALDGGELISRDQKAERTVAGAIHPHRPAAIDNIDIACPHPIRAIVGGDMCAAGRHQIETDIVTFITPAASQIAHSNYRIRGGLNELGIRALNPGQLGAKRPDAIGYADRLKPPHYAFAPIRQAVCLGYVVGRVDVQRSRRASQGRLARCREYRFIRFDHLCDE
jgi:hypothetical protein